MAIKISASFTDMIDPSFFESQEIKAYKELGKLGKLSIPFEGVKYRVFSGELFGILLSSAIPSQGKTFNGTEYKVHYVNGFIKGKKYFAENFKVSLDTLITNPTPYVDMLKGYYHTKAPGLNFGWEQYGKGYPENISDKLTEKSIEEIGHYAGIIDSIFTLRKEYPEQFKDFETEKETKPGLQIGNIKAAHHVLAYIFDCHATAVSPPSGSRSKLESIGNERIGANKGNAFYKNFNRIIGKDLNVESNLIAIGGEDWRSIVLSISKNREEVERYLRNKQL